MGNRLRVPRICPGRLSGAHSKEDDGWGSSLKLQVSTGPRFRALNLMP